MAVAINSDPIARSFFISSSPYSYHCEKIDRKIFANHPSERLSASTPEGLGAWGPLNRGITTLDNHVLNNACTRTPK
jgi:hypothetical protein